MIRVTNLHHFYFIIFFNQLYYNNLLRLSQHINPIHHIMSLAEFIILVIIAGICGSIGQAISGFSRGGCFLSIVIGFIGALIGMALADTLNLPDFFEFQAGGVTFPVIWSIIGAAIFVAFVGLLTRRR